MRLNSKRTQVWNKHTLSYNGLIATNMYILHIYVTVTLVVKLTQNGFKKFCVGYKVTIIHHFYICQTNLLRSRAIPSYIYNITDYTLPTNGFAKVRLLSTRATVTHTQPTRP